MIKNQMWKTKEQIAKEYISAGLIVSSVILIGFLDLSGTMFVLDSSPFAVIVNSLYYLFG